MASENWTTAKVAHVMPGRLRLRIDKPADVDEVARRIAQSLSGVSGVISIEPRPTARSVLIRFDPNEVLQERLIETGVRGAGISTAMPAAPSPGRGSDETTVGRVVLRSFGRVSGGLGKATRGTLDLRDLFPAVLFGLGLRRVAQGQLEPVPWYNLLYYGYSAFTIHHSQGEASGPDAREILRQRYARGELTREQFREMMEEISG